MAVLGRISNQFFCIDCLSNTLLQLLPSVIPLPNSLNSPVMLCETCRTLLLDLINFDYPPSRWTSSPKSYRYPFRSAAHKGLDTSTNCPMCQFIHGCMLKGSVMNLRGQPCWEWHAFHHSKGFFEIVDIFGSSSITVELFSRTNRSSNSSFGEVVDQQSDLDQHLDTKLVNDNLKLWGRTIHRYSGSQPSMHLASSWSSNCAQHHRLCQGRNSKQLLPNRVIDVGNDPDEQPRLMESQGEHGFYATLSHRWGNVAGQYCTTRDNISEHMRCLDINSLPASFRDAVIICRDLGIPYLWIDSICIIQGDNEDWQKECKNMSKIFENSYLTISALRAENSHAGIFHERFIPPSTDRNDIPLFKLNNGTDIWVCPYRQGNQITDDLVTSVMNSRGWILQERLLSTAILHFGSTQMHWECRGLAASENRPSVSTGGYGLLKNFLLENDFDLSTLR